MTACIRNHPAPGLHLPYVDEDQPGCGRCRCRCHSQRDADGRQAPCDAPGGCWQAHEGCTGCAPAPATHGVFCDADHATLYDLLGGREKPEGPHGLPWIWELLEAAIQPRAGGSDTRASQNQDPPAPVELAAIDLRTEMRHRLRGHCAEIAQEYNLSPPGPSSSVRELTGWLLKRLQAVEALEVAGVLWDDATDWASRAHALLPWRPTVKRMEGVPCPLCHTPGSLALFGGEEDWKCLGCKGKFIAKDVARWEKWYAQQASQDVG